MKRYNLTHNNEYIFIDITDNGDCNYTTCDNCGTLIRYVVHLQDINNKNYFVGTECVKTLLQCKINNDFSMNEQLNAFKKVAEIRNLIETNNKLKIFSSENSAVIVGLTKNNKPKKLYIKRTFDNFQQKWYTFIDLLLSDIKKMHSVNDWCYNDIFNYYNSIK